MSDLTAEDMIASHIVRLQKITPSSFDLAKKDALLHLEEMKRQAENLGRMFYKGFGSGKPQDIPKLRESLPFSVPSKDKPETNKSEKKENPEKSEKKEASVAHGLIEAVIDPTLEHVRNAFVGLKNIADEKITRGLRTTSDPTTVPGYGPMMAHELPRAFFKGYKEESEKKTKSQGKAIEKELARAQQEFEDVLAEEAASSKNASVFGIKRAVQALSKLATDYAMDKSADGELMQALNAYGALATLLGEAGYETGRRYAIRRDEDLKKYKELSKLIQRRTNSDPLVIIQRSQQSDADPAPLEHTSAVDKDKEPEKTAEIVKKAVPVPPQKPPGTVIGNPAAQEFVAMPPRVARRAPLVQAGQPPKPAPTQARTTPGSPIAGAAASVPRPGSVMSKQPAPTPSPGSVARDTFNNKPNPGSPSNPLRLPVDFPLHQRPGDVFSKLMRSGRSAEAQKFLELVRSGKYKFGPVGQAGYNRVSGLLSATDAQTARFNNYFSPSGFSSLASLSQPPVQRVPTVNSVAGTNWMPWVAGGSLAAGSGLAGIMRYLNKESSLSKNANNSARLSGLVSSRTSLVPPDRNQMVVSPVSNQTKILKTHYVPASSSISSLKTQSYAANPEEKAFQAVINRPGGLVISKFPKDPRESPVRLNDFDIISASRGKTNPDFIYPNNFQSDAVGILKNPSSPVGAVYRNLGISGPLVDKYRNRAAMLYNDHLRDVATGVIGGLGSATIAGGSLALPLTLGSFNDI